MVYSTAGRDIRGWRLWLQSFYWAVLVTPQVVERPEFLSFCLLWNLKEHVVFRSLTSRLVRLFPDLPHGGVIFCRAVNKSDQHMRVILCWCVRIRLLFFIQRDRSGITAPVKRKGTYSSCRNYRIYLVEMKRIGGL